MLDHYRMFADYNRWANRRVYAAVSELSDSEYREDKGAFFGSLHGTLNHILVADRIWMKRFTKEGEAPSRLDAILHEDLNGLTAARVAEDERIIAWIDSLDEERLAGTSPILAHQSGRGHGTARTDARSLLQPSDPSSWPGACDLDRA